MKTLKLQEKLSSSTGRVLGAIVVAASIISTASNVYAVESTTNTPSFYLGADAVYSRMGFKGNYGSNIFEKSAPGINVFVGHLFNNNFGAEVGFEIEKKEKKSGNINAGTYFAGWVVPPMGGFSFNSEVKQRHPYLGLVGNLNINNDFFVQGLLGVSVSNVHAKYTWTDSALNFADAATFSKTKPVAMVRLSVGYKLTDKFDVRAYTTWRNTSNIKIKSPDTTRGNLIKLKDTYNVGLGVVYHIV
jgi:hypothetical protein